MLTDFSDIPGLFVRFVEIVTISKIYKHDQAPLFKEAIGYIDRKACLRGKTQCFTLLADAGRNLSKQ